VKFVLWLILETGFLVYKSRMVVTTPDRWAISHLIFMPHVAHINYDILIWVLEQTYSGR